MSCTVKITNCIALTDNANLAILLERVPSIFATLFKLIPLKVLVLFAIASGKSKGQI